MVSQALNAMTTAVNSATNAVSSIFKTKLGGKTATGGHKTDPIFQFKNRDTLARAAYACDINTLFRNKDVEPYLVYDTTVAKVVNKLAALTFPLGTSFRLDVERNDDPLLGILKETDFYTKTQLVVQEGALMGWCALRSVYSEGRWITEVKQKEMTEPTYVGDKLVMIAFYAVREKDGKRYWRKESWDFLEHKTWAEKPESRQGVRPEFKEEDAIVVPNPYGEIPATIVAHRTGVGLIGLPVINEPEIGAQKALVRLRHNLHTAHVKHMSPPVVRKNHSSPGDPLEVGANDVIDIEDGGNDRVCDLKLLEFTGIPESVRHELYDHECLIYSAAGLKPPPADENPTVGTNNSGTALRVLHKEDLDTVEELRAKSYDKVAKHLELVLRMAARIGEVDGVDPDNEDTWRVVVSFPEFFPNTEQDNQAALMTLNMAELPPALKAPRVCKVLGITDENEVALLLSHYESQQAMMEPNLSIGG